MIVIFFCLEKKKIINRENSNVGGKIPQTVWIHQSPITISAVIDCMSVMLMWCTNAGGSSEVIIRPEVTSDHWALRKKLQPYIIIIWKERWIMLQSKNSHATFHFTFLFKRLGLSEWYVMMWVILKDVLDCSCVIWDCTLWTVSHHYRGPCLYQNVLEYKQELR